MKAFDFEEALRSEDPLRAVEELSKTFNFERDLLKICQEAKMTKIVRVLGDGFVPHVNAPLGRVFYLLFELADGDLRAEFEYDDTKSIARW